jgi:multidrug efflux system membrane fusion protein
MDRPLQVPLRLETQHGETVITLDPSDLAATKIETTPLEKLARPATVTAYGRVLDLTPLLDLQSRFAASSAQEEQARTALVTAQREYERFKNLYDQGGIVSQKQVEDAQAAVQANEASLRASATARQALYDAIRQGWGQVLAEDLERRTPEFQRLASRKELLVELTLSPGAQPATPPMLAVIRSGNVGPVQGNLVAPAPQSNADIQGVAYLFAVPAASQGAGGPTAQGLLPGMAVTAWLPAGPVQQGVVVPDDAVVWKDGKAWVYLKKAPSQFVRRGVILESPTGRGWFIPEDQLPDLPVVIRGAQVLLSEESRGQVRPEV